MKDRRKLRGRLGEQFAYDDLLAKGYVPVERNWRCSRGEIDIIMKQASSLVFVEVRTTTSARFGMGYESVDMRKIQKLRSLAHYYIAYRKMDAMTTPIQFDVVSVLLAEDESLHSIQHIPHAF